MNAVRRHGVDVVLIALAIVVQTIPIDAGWLEHTYANGIYPALATTFVPLVNRVPFTLGDVFITLGGALLAIYWLVRRRRPGESAAGKLGALGLRTAAVLAVIVLWFNAAWALNYRRVPVVGRVAFDRARLTPANVSAFSAQIVAALNAAAPLAHARSESEPQMERALAQAFAPVVRRLGDRYAVVVSRPKATSFNRWFATAGIGGVWDPFAYETIVNSDFLPFERPFAIAHEWGHVAGFGDESDANLIAALTTLRSDDPFIRYSGLFWAYGFLPAGDRAKLALSPLVTADLRAAQARFERHYNPRIFALQWYLYDKYLRANRVGAGVVSYSLFVSVLVGTPLDRDGLPLVRLSSPRREVRAKPARVVREDRALRSGRQSQCGDGRAVRGVGVGNIGIVAAVHDSAARRLDLRRRRARA